MAQPAMAPALLLPEGLSEFQAAAAQNAEAGVATEITIQGSLSGPIESTLAKCWAVAPAAGPARVDLEFQVEAGRDEVVSLYRAPTVLEGAPLPDELVACLGRELAAPIRARHELARHLAFRGRYRTEVMLPPPPVRGAPADGMP